MDYLEDLIVEYSQRIKKQPKNAELYYNRGVIYNMVQKYHAAIQDFSISIDLDMDLVDAYRNRAMVYMKLQEYTKALSDCNIYIKCFPQEVDAYTNRATVYYHLQNFPASLKDWNKVIDLQPGNGEAYLQRGNAYLALKDYQNALNDFDMAAQIKPDYAEEWVQRGRAKMQLKDYQGALDDFEKAQSMGIKNQNVNLSFLMASAKARVGKYEEALPELLRFVQATPTAAANYDVAQVYFSIQNYETALNYAREAALSEPKNAQYRMFLGMTRIKLKDYAEAVKDLEQAIKISPEFWQAYYELGKCRIEQKKHKAALLEFDKAIKLNPQHLDSYKQRAICSLATKAYPDAITDLNMVLKADPENLEALDLLIETRWQLKQYATLIDQLSHLVEKHPETAKWYYLRAKCAMNLGKYGSAIADLNAFEVFTLHTITIDFYKQRCNCYLQIQDLAYAKKDFEKMMQLDKTEGQNFLIELATTISTLFNLQKYAEVVDVATDLLELDNQNPSILYKRALAFQKLKKYEGSLADFTQLIDLQPKQVVFYYERGLLYEKLEKLSEAKADFERIEQLDIAAAEKYASEYFHYAKLKVKSKNYAPAILDLDRCLMFYRNYGLALLLRGECNAALGEKQKALQDYAQGYHLTPNDAYRLSQEHKIEANIKLGAQNFRAAKHLFDYAIVLNPENGSLYEKIAQCEEALDEWENALKNYEIAYQKGIFNTELVNRITVLKEKVNASLPLTQTHTPKVEPEIAEQKQENDELAKWNEMILENPNHANAYLERGKYYATHQQYEAAIRDFEAAIHLCKDDTKLVYTAIQATFEAVKMVFYGNKN